MHVSFARAQVRRVASSLWCCCCCCACALIFLPLFFFSICVVIAVSSKSPSAFVGWRSPRSFSYRVVCVYVVCVVGFFFFSGIQNAHHRPRRLLPLSLDGRHEQILSAKRGYNGTAVVQSGSSATNQKSVRQRGQKSTLGLKSLTRASMEEAEEVELDAMERMEKAMEVMSDNFATVRTGRANPNMLDRIEVDYYGAMTPLKSLSNTNNLDAQTLVIQPFDKGALKEIEKAIVRSDLGITPSNDGSVIRLVVPPLTAERRKELTKQVSKLGEEGKVALRNVRRDAMTKIKKMKTDKTLGEDEVASFEKKIEELTSSYVKKTDDAVKAKEKELTTV